MKRKREYEPEDDPKLSQAWSSASDEEPPPYLDDAILAVSRREAGSRPRAFGPFASHWTVPASLAAVLVLSVVVVIGLQQQTGTPGTVQPPQSGAGKEAAEGDAGMQQEAEVPAAKSAGEPATTPEAGAMQRDDSAGPVAGPDPAQPESPPASRMLRPLEAPPPVVAEEPAMLKSESQNAVSDAAPSEQDWLKQIERLWQGNEKERAVQQLRAFLKRYPDYGRDRLRQVLDAALVDIVIPVKDDESD